MEYHTVFFGSDRYRQLTNALKLSVEFNSEHKLVVHEIAPKYNRQGRQKLIGNTIKIEKWNEIVQEARQNIVLMDCDMVLLKDVSHVFDMDFDMCYTKRKPTSRFPLNGGVVFIKPTKKTKEFFQRWKDMNSKMMGDPAFHNPYYKKYAGINQASLGYLLENGHGIKMAHVPCSKYNACDEGDWSMNDDVHILHVKSDLQSQCFSREIFRHREAVEVWRKYYVK